ncbi:unnamed protein product [Arctia plantaginis]|uniref:Uncharacterized protein n=1 Tax=Arctia plantaginis TaxID=874455 RepID=A0A8S1ALM0_ARCPL|nr:unnamed protein product [Arctia plantaginis]CAB3250552.1 unnamed protein product [Arctia plantaginis]
MLSHQPSFQVPHDYYYDANPNYKFAYEVNNAHTGDFKSQHESRRGGTVLGQYSLIQPDGVQRTVDYRADDHSRFQATVNNQERQANGHAANVNINSVAVERQSNSPGSLANFGNVRPVQSYQAWPTSTGPHPDPTPSVPVAVSRSSFVQTISHGPVPTPRNRHNLWE